MMDTLASGLSQQLVYTHWFDCSRRLQCPPDVTKRWFERLAARYSERQRHYHTLNHLEEMLQHYEQIQDHLQDKNAVLLATFFHDIIYDPKAADNEEKSAEEFSEYSEECSIEQNFQQKVKDWIIATKTHSTEAHKSPGQYGDLDLHYFLDMDMVVLGRPAEAYKKYSDQIRQEYVHIEERLYKQARSQVLQKFLEVPNIFATKEFREKYETRARENIKAEIQQLTSGP